MNDDCGDGGDTTSNSKNLILDACADTIQKFEAMFPNESFFPKVINNKDIRASKEADLLSSTRLDGFDVKASCQRQATFLWQVSGERFHDDQFLQDGVENYLKFIYLVKDKSRPEYLVPTYQIDLMWHTHILTSLRDYHMDTMAITGGEIRLDHDDSLNDRSEDSKLNHNFELTQKLWKKVFVVNYNVPGGMYRGEPSPRFYHHDWPNKVKTDAPVIVWKHKSVG
eukprot:1148984_1